MNYLKKFAVIYGWRRVIVSSEARISQRNEKGSAMCKMRKDKLRRFCAILTRCRVKGAVSTTGWRQRVPNRRFCPQDDNLMQTAPPLPPPSRFFWRRDTGERSLLYIVSRLSRRTKWRRLGEHIAHCMMRPMQGVTSFRSRAPLVNTLPKEGETPASDANTPLVHIYESLVITVGRLLWLASSWNSSSYTLYNSKTHKIHQ